MSETITNQVLIDSTCKSCGTYHSAIVSEESMNAYRDGAMTQDAFGDELSAWEREFYFITGFCGPCFTNLLS